MQVLNPLISRVDRVYEAILADNPLDAEVSGSQWSYSCRVMGEVHDQNDTHGKVVGTRLQFADHAAMARAFGMYAERVEKVEDLAGAIERGPAHRPVLLDVVVTTEARSSDAKTGLAWVPDLQPLAAWDDAERIWRSGKSQDDLQHR